MSCADGGSGGRGGRRSTKRSPPRSRRNVKFDPPPSPIRLAPTGPLPRPCASRNASTRSGTISGSAIAAMLRRADRGDTRQRDRDAHLLGPREALAEED